MGYSVTSPSEHHTAYLTLHDNETAELQEPAENHELLAA
jgi:hypothetical protein